MLVEAAVDDKGDAVHQPGLLQGHQQHHQRNHVGHDDAGQADQAVEHGASDHAAGGYRLPVGECLGQPHRGHRVDPAADLEHHEQHGGEYGEAADQAPMRMQEQLVEPVAPAAPVRGAPMRMAASTSVAARWWRSACSSSASGRGSPGPAGLAQASGTRAAGRKMLASSPSTKPSSAANCISNRGCGTRNAAWIRGGSWPPSGPAGFRQYAARRLRQRTGGLARRIDGAREQLRDALPHQRHGRHHRHAQQLFQRLDVDRGGPCAAPRPCG
jgi:hypothetical protein